MSRAGTAFVTSSNSRVSSHKAYLRVLLQYVHYGVLRCTTVCIACSVFIADAVQTVQTLSVSTIGTIDTVGSAAVLQQCC